MSLKTVTETEACQEMATNVTVKAKVEDLRPQTEDTWASRSGNK